MLLLLLTVCYHTAKPQQFFVRQRIVRGGGDGCGCGHNAVAAAAADADLRCGRGGRHQHAGMCRACRMVLLLLMVMVMALVVIERNGGQPGKCVEQRSVRMRLRMHCGHGGR